ncbi:MAG: hypothetical protein WCC15_08150 [Candidatus Acidiferrales bacterium]
MLPGACEHAELVRRRPFYVVTENDYSNLWSQPIAGGNPQQITHFRNGFMRAFDV